MNRRRVLAITGVVPAGAIMNDITVFAAAKGLTRTRAVALAATAFLALLDRAQKQAVLFRFAPPAIAEAVHFRGGLRGDVDMMGERYGDAVWSNFPVKHVPRPGLRMGALDGPQRAAVHDLLRAMLSPDGFRKVGEIMGSDQALSEGGTPYASGRDAYTIAIFGEPGDAAPWMVQFGGHHLALNLAMKGGRGVLAPVLTGCLPAVYVENGTTVRALAAENDKAFVLLASLDADQRRQAIIDHPVSTLAQGPGHDGETVEPQGLPGSAMTAAQRAMLFGLVGEWAGLLNDDHAAPRRDQGGPRRHPLRLERPHDARGEPERRLLLPGPRPHALHRVRVAGARRRPDHARPHDLPRSVERLWACLCVRRRGAAARARGLAAQVTTPGVA